MTCSRTVSKLAVIFSITILFTGCASTTPEFCDSNSWKERGYAHAVNGNNDQTKEARNDCAAEDAPLAYRVGFDYGLKKYCTFKRGMWAGEMGQGPAESCTDAKWDEYQTGYITGHQIFELNTHLEAISKELEAARSELWALEAAGQPPASPVVKAQLARIETLERERDQASRHLMNLKADTRPARP